MQLYNLSQQAGLQISARPIYSKELDVSNIFHRNMEKMETPENPFSNVPSLRDFQFILGLDLLFPRQSFREGLCNHRRWFVCLFVCYHGN